MKNSQKGFVVPLLIIIAVLAIAGGIYFWQKNKTVTVPSTVETSVNNISATTTTSQDLSVAFISPSTASVNQTIMIEGSGFSKTNPNNEEGMGWGYHNPTAVKLTNSQGRVAQLSVSTVSDDNHLTFTIPSLPVCLPIERGCGPSDPASLFMNVMPGVYSVAVEDGVTGTTSNAVTLTIVATSTNQISSAVPGMTQYTDSNFGFSFWYPSGWNVQITNTGASPDPLVKELSVFDSSGNKILYVDEFNEFKISNWIDNEDSEAFYFDSSLHTWMYTRSSGNQTTNTPANVSVNTMGGLHMLSSQSDQTNYNQLIPLSATKFVDVSDSSYKTNIIPLAKTIVATDPSVATPVGTAEQTQTIQAEMTAYTQ